MPGQAQMPGAPGAVHNPYAHAQGALKGTGSMLKYMQIGFTVMGGLMAVGGLIWLISGSVGGGAGLLITGVVFVAVAWLMLPQFKSLIGGVTGKVDALAAKSNLAQTGMPATGRLLSVQQTGTLINYNPEVVAMVEVNHPQMGTYQVQTTTVVPQMSIPQFQPGAQVQVRIDPANPQNIAVVV